VKSACVTTCLFTLLYILNDVYLVNLDEFRIVLEFLILEGLEKVIDDDVTGMTHTFHAHFYNLRTANFTDRQFENRLKLHISRKLRLAKITTF